MSHHVRKVCLIFLVSEGYDCLTPFEQAFNQAGFDVEAIGLPNVWLGGLTVKYVDHLKALIRQKKSEGCFVIYSPQSTELFLKEPDLTIAYSAYRSWFDGKKMRVIPHLWTPVRPPESIEQIRWTRKPPLRIGFMGRSYRTSRLVNIIMKSPKAIRHWLLQGRHLRHPEIIALMNEVKAFTTFNAFPRIETIELLEANKQHYSQVELDITAKAEFYGLEQEFNAYVKHLERCTYILCPRGTENYSFRIYEALNRGRIPVIIDTDVVLPKEIDWEQLSIRVPYESLDSIYDIILSDYNTRSDADFIARQELAFATMAELQTMRWMKDLADELSGRLSDSLA